MRRFLTLVCLLCLAIPAGISISGCTRNPGENYCNGLGYGAGIDDVYSITLKPTSGSLSLAYGQTKQANSPTAYTCKNATASVSSYTYGSSDTSVLDISPSGMMCAGTWNRNTGGGVSDYTICTANDPTTTYSSSKLPYAAAYITATASGVTSNQVLVYVHAPVTSMSLAGPSECLSQGTTWSSALDVSAYYTDSNGDSQQICSPNSSSLPECANSIGTLTYTLGTSSVATVDSTTNKITAQLPGTTLISATVADSSSTAGSFSTCAPASIALAFSSGATSATITKGQSQTLTTTVKDTLGSTISGLSLDYQSTEIEDITVSSAGVITPTYPGSATVFAVCQPSSCNPAPTSLVGLYGTGLPVSSNPVKITVPGTASQYVWYAAPGKSQYFVPVELLTGSVGSSVKLTYVPNSMKMDKAGTSLYFGSTYGMMIYNASSNGLTKTVTGVPGVVLAVSPDNTYVLVNDQVKEVFYVYNVSSGSATASYGGLGTDAVFSPDDKTLYISDSKALGGDHKDAVYVYNTTNGWSTYSTLNTDIYSANGTSCSTNTASCSRSLAMTVPSAGVYVSGAETVSHTHCPSGTIGSALSYYPLGDTIALASDKLATSPDGTHLLGAALDASGNTTLSDVDVTIPTSTCPGVYDTSNSAYEANYPASGDSLTALTTSPSFLLQNQDVTINATNLHDIVISPSSGYAFLTYEGTTTGATLPYYEMSSGAAGTLNYLTLTDATTPVITAPVAAAFSPDNKILFVSTSGDNKVHYIYFQTDGTPYDDKQIAPGLTACDKSTDNDAGCTITGLTTVPATVITVKPRSTT